MKHLALLCVLSTSALLASPQQFPTATKRLALKVSLGMGTAATMDDLRNLLPNSSDAVLLLGYHAAGDGGGGSFYWDGGSTAADDAGTVILPAANPTTGRWKRLQNESRSAKWFGAIGDGAPHPLSGFFPSIVQAQALYPHVTSLEDEMDWTAIQAAVDSLPATGPSGIARLGGGEIRIPAGDYRLSQPIEITVDNTGVVGEGNAATTLTYAAAVQTSDWAFFRSGLDILTETVFRIRIRGLFLDMGTGGPDGAIGIDVTGMSHSHFREMTMQFRSLNCTGVLGTAANGASPYYNLFTDISIYGPAPFATNGCRGYHFTGNASLPNGHPDRLKAPNANLIRGGHLASLQIGYDDVGTGNTVVGLVIESVLVAFDLGEVTTSGPWLGKSSTTNHTTILGAYQENGPVPGSTALVIRDSAGGVKYVSGFRTGFASQYLDDGHETTILPGSGPASLAHGKIGGHVDFDRAPSVLNTEPNLTLETELSSFGFEPSIHLNQKHATDIRISNGSNSASSMAFRVYDRSEAREMFRCSPQGDLRAEGDVEVGRDILFTGGSKLLNGLGAPTMSAGPGSLYLRLDGGPGSTFYVREGGTWTAK
jgi:hypothetical protein